MAFEHLIAFLENRSLDSLQPVTQIGLDKFGLLECSDLKKEHQALTELIDFNGDKDITLGAKIQESLSAVFLGHKGGKIFEQLEQNILKGDEQQRTRMLQALIERIFWYEYKILTVQHKRTGGDYFFKDALYKKYLVKLIDLGTANEETMLAIFLWICAHDKYYLVNWSPEVLEAFLCKLEGIELSAQIKKLLISIRTFFYRDKSPHKQKNVKHIDSLIGEGIFSVIFPIEVWTEEFTKEIEQMPDAERRKWFDLLSHCQKAHSTKPSSKWLKDGEKLVDAIGKKVFQERCLIYFELFERGRVVDSETVDKVSETHLLTDDNNCTVLRGLAWLTQLVAGPDVCRALGRLSLSANKKIKNYGARSVKVGNAAMYSLSQIGSVEAVAQLAILKSRLKLPSAQASIDKGFNEVAKTSGIPKEDLEEMAIPNYGLNADGRLEKELDEQLIYIQIVNSKVVLGFRDSKGKELKSAPISVKTNFAQDLIEFKKTAKDIEKMLPVQISRIEQMFPENKHWSYSVWQERYAMHPLLKTICDRLIWQFKNSDNDCSAIFHKENFVNSQNKIIDWLKDDTDVSLWHPIYADAATVNQWQDWLERNEVKQPFKQAHREIYVLTDAEIATENYSNRFASHIVKHHQFNALCGARGWRNKLRILNVDGMDEPPSKVIIGSGIKAEYWVEGLGDEYQRDTAESGAFLYLNTDQVRFYLMKDLSVLLLRNVPPIIFSEIMRDVDLFVGVTSIGNDPNWQDGGFQDRGYCASYWQSYSFGELTVSAQFRKAVLQNLIPKLKIADRCSFNENFLVVKGDRRTYKIHIGSGNILMEPNNQYLCIVPQQGMSKKVDDIFLPFEGDQRLSIILSKAFMLAEDKKISDPSIISQIKRN